MINLLLLAAILGAIVLAVVVDLGAVAIWITRRVRLPDTNASEMFNALSTKRKGALLERALRNTNATGRAKDQPTRPGRKCGS